ncbi:MAG TPA: hypothetical protein V6C58_04070, partial [Allocoleopsis sp.]
MAVKRPGDKATKAQIMDAFDQLESERKELEDQVKKLQKEIKEKPVIVQQTQPPVKEIKPVQEVKETKEVK